jgi:hypothetical protein
MAVAPVVLHATAMVLDLLMADPGLLDQEAHRVMALAGVDREAHPAVTLAVVALEASRHLLMTGGDPPRRWGDLRVRCEVAALLLGLMTAVRLR